MEVEDSDLVVVGSDWKVEDSDLKVEGSSLEVEDSVDKVEGSDLKAEGSDLEVKCSEDSEVENGFEPVRSASEVDGVSLTSALPMVVVGFGALPWSKGSVAEPLPCRPDTGS